MNMLNNLKDELNQPLSAQKGKFLSFKIFGRLETLTNFQIPTWTPT